MPVLQDSLHAGGDTGHLADHATVARLLNLSFQVESQSPASGATFRPDVGLGAVHVVNLSGPTTIGAAGSSASASPTPQFFAGQRIVFILVQDAAGGRVVSWDPSYIGSPLVVSSSLASSKVEFVNVAATGSAPSWMLLSPDVNVLGTLFQAAGSSVGGSLGYLALPTGVAGISLPGTVSGVVQWTDITGLPLVIAPNLGTRDVEVFANLLIQPSTVSTVLLGVYDGVAAEVIMADAFTESTSAGFFTGSVGDQINPGAGVRTFRPVLGNLGSSAITATVYGKNVNKLTSRIGCVQR